MLISIFSLFSCSKSITITNANKQYFKRGVPSGKDYVNYTILLEAKEDFVVEDIVLNDLNDLKFYYKDLSTGLSSYKKLISYPKGKYKFGFRTSNIDDFDNNDSITFYYLIKGKSSFKKVLVKEIKSIQKR